MVCRFNKFDSVCSESGFTGVVVDYYQDKDLYEVWSDAEWRLIQAEKLTGLNGTTWSEEEKDKVA